MPVKKGLSYTSRTLRECRERGYICDKAEKFNQYAGPFGRREDLFGFIDIIYLDPQKGIVAIQSTGPHGHSEHRRKILENSYALEWLKCGGVIELWSWRKLLKQRGGRLRLWTPRIEEIKKKNFLES
jgi:hypothetical protein